MGLEIDFIYLATQGSPNVVTQATYAASGYVGPGLGSGILASNVLNKILRQGTAGAAMLATFIGNQLNQNVLDNGNLATLVAQLTAAIQQASTTRPARIVTSSAGFTLALSDFRVALNRTVAVAAQAIALPAGAVVGQSFIIEDIQGNLSGTTPVTVSPPVGSISNSPTFIMNEDKQSAEFTYYGSNLWSVDS